MAPDEVTPRRGPGRPRQTDQEQARVREQILAATEQVFASHGHRDVTVTRIIDLAGITRPNFYRYYRNAQEPLRIMLERVTGELTTEIVGRVSRATSGPDRLAAGIDAYLDWSRRFRPLLPSILADLHDPTSPVSELRRHTLDVVVDVTARGFVETGRSVPSRTIIDIFVNAIEYTSFRLFVDTDGSDEAVDQARSVMLRIAVAVLGRPHMWIRRCENVGFS
jgi:AcrR family transcriptional regulator